MLGLGATAFSHEAWKVWLNNLFDDLKHLNLYAKYAKKLMRQKKCTSKSILMLSLYLQQWMSVNLIAFRFTVLKKITWVIQAWGTHNFTVWTEVAFPLNRGPFHMVRALWFWSVNGPFQLTLLLWNSKADRYIKAALQALENILGNQNSLALMRGREWHFFSQCNEKGWPAVYLPVEISLERKNVYFFPLGHNLETQGICCPPRSTIWWFHC